MIQCDSSTTTPMIRSQYFCSNFLASSLSNISGLEYNKWQSHAFCRVVSSLTLQALSPILSQEMIWSAMREFKESRDGRVVRALPSYQCDPGSIPGPSVHMWVEFVVGSRPCSEGFSSGFPVCLPPSKTNTPNSNLISCSYTFITSSKLLRVTWVNKLQYNRGEITMSIGSDGNLLSIVSIDASSCAIVRQIW